jgi:transcriptional regulator with XRE-family HTH domain
MTEFAAALKTWVEHHPDLSINRLGTEAKVASSEMSRISRGEKQPTFETLCKLLPAVARLSSRSDARTLLVAYLREETPPEFRKDVRILAVDDKTGDVDNSDLLSLAAARWLRHSRSDPEFARMWLTMDGYMHEADSDAVDERVRQFEADQIASLGLNQTPASTRTLGQILAGYDLHTLSERTGISVAELQRLQTGKDPFTGQVLKSLAPGISIEDMQALLQLPLAANEPPNIHQLPQGRGMQHLAESLRAAEEPPPVGKTGNLRKA